MIANKRSFFYLRLFIDLVFLNGAFILAAVLSQSFSLLLDRSYMFVLAAILNFVWYFISNVLNFYDDFNTRYFSFQFTTLLKNVIAQAVVSVFFIFLVKEDLFTRNFIVIYSMLLIVLVSIRIQGLRSIMWAVIGREKNQRNLLIIGAGELGQSFQKLITTHRDFGFTFAGYIDNVQETEKKDEVVGSIKDLEEVILSKKIDTAVIAIPLYESSRLNEIITTCNRHAVRTHIIPDYFQFLSKKFRMNMLGDLPIITIRDEPLAEFHWRLVKRSFDIIFSLLAILLLLSWMIPLIYCYLITTEG